MLPAAISFSEPLNSQYPNTQQQKQCNGVMDLDELSKSEHSLKFPTGPPGDDSAMTSGYISAYILCVCVIQLASIFTSSLLTIMYCDCSFKTTSSCSVHCDQVSCIN